MKKYLFILFVVFYNNNFAQVSINTDGSTPDNSAILDIKSTTKGMLISRMTSAERMAVSLPAEGLVVYDTDSKSFWYYNGNRWTETEEAGKCWLLSGNTGSTFGTNFIGTIDDQALDIRTNNIIKTRITTKGQIEILNTGHSVFIGENVGADDDMSNNQNVFIGYYSGNSNTTGSSNTAIGNNSLFLNTTGYSNVAIGTSALYKNTDRTNLVAIGDSALYHNGEGASTHYAKWNTAIGSKSLFNNTRGWSNSGIGYEVLKNNTIGERNTAIGHQGLLNNNTGNRNTAIGFYSLYSNTTGERNTAIGDYSLDINTTGTDNTAVGTNAYFTINNLSNTSCFGYNSGAVSNVSNRIEIGNSSVSWIGGQVTWSTYSDRRIKTNILENVSGLDFISRLRPVTYNLNIHKMNKMMKRSGKDKEVNNWKGKYDIETMKMTGFIAQEVEQAAKESGYNFSGVQKAKDNLSMYSISYSQFVVPLVKATQEQQQIIEELKQEIQLLKDEINTIKQKLNNYD